MWWKGRHEGLRVIWALYWKLYNECESIGKLLTDNADDNSEANPYFKVKTEVRDIIPRLTYYKESRRDCNSPTNY